MSSKVGGGAANNLLRNLYDPLQGFLVFRCVASKPHRDTAGQHTSYCDVINHLQQLHLQPPQKSQERESLLGLWGIMQWSTVSTLSPPVHHHFSLTGVQLEALDLPPVYCPVSAGVETLNRSVICELLNGVE